MERWYRKDVAENAVRDLTGVKGVTNLITIKPRLVASEVETSIEAAFERNALLDAEEVHVETSDNKVTLSGTVRITPSETKRNALPEPRPVWLRWTTNSPSNSLGVSRIDFRFASPNVPKEICLTP